MSLILQRAVRDTLHSNKKEMPFAVIGAAVAGAVSTAFAAGAGAAVALGATAGGALATAAGVVSAVATVATWVGAGLTVIGAVTGNTTLMKVGGYIGLAGGITGIAVAGVNAAVGATAVATTTSTATAAGTEGANAATAAGTQAGTQAGQQAAQQLGQQALNRTVETAIPNTIEGVTGATTNAATNVVQGTGQQAVQQAVQQVGQSSVENATTQAVNEAGTKGVEGVVDATNKGMSLSDKATSFFENVFSNDKLLTVTGEIVKGVAQGNQQDRLMDIEKQKLALDSGLLNLRERQYNNELAAQERAYKNANTQGTMNISYGQPLSQEQIDSYRQAQNEHRRQLDQQELKA